ncbi:hypothetical protein MNV49_006528 [Pseudohyphozyma bogoriensis]|nr:hypothetical protein MNV49_006528 [Pseudohyphozyma bogoriensis]
MSNELSFESTARFHRVPVGFGPAPTPRQDPTGKRFDWSKAQATTAGVTYVSEHAALNAILPDGYHVDEEVEATVMFEVMELRNLPWLNGRGYNTWGVYINNVVCERTKERYVGSYMAVLFESFTDPITTGREELGFCKLWAELPDAQLDGTTRTHTASWFGTEFMKLVIPNMNQKDVSEAPANHPRAWTHPTQSGILHHRYIPTVGQPGKHDASYTTWCPPPPGKPPLLSYFTIPASEFANVKLDISEGKWEELPTLWNVVEGLRGIPRERIVEVAVQQFQGASDLIANQKVE